MNVLLIPEFHRMMTLDESEMSQLSNATYRQDSEDIEVKSPDKGDRDGWDISETLLKYWIRY